jgi:hypothetical protein
MNAPWRFLSPILVLLAASVFCAKPLPVYASDGPEAPVAKRSVSAREKKVITNDDLQAKYGKPSVSAEMKSSRTISASSEPTAAAITLKRSVRRERLAPERDPQWFARQSVSLSDEIANIDAQAQMLLQFRAPGNTPRAGTGLILNAPCEGITTDNRIAQLLARRHEIEEQMSELEDVAHRNDMPPGLFVEAPAMVASSSQATPLTPAQQRAALAEKLGQLTDQLKETQEEVAYMAADTAARRMTLLRPNGYGANMTTDLLARLGGQSAMLESEINRVTDDALRVGIPARDLP